MSTARFDLGGLQLAGPPRYPRVALDPTESRSVWGTRRPPRLPDERGAEVIIETGLDPEYRMRRLALYPTTERAWLESRWLAPVPTADTPSALKEA